MKLNFIKSEKGIMKWKQVEIKDGLIFFRWKQRIYRDEFVHPQMRLER